MPKWRNPLPSTRTICPSTTAGGNSAQSAKSFDPAWFCMMLRDCAAVIRKMPTFTAIRMYVTSGTARCVVTAPATLRT